MTRNGKWILEYDGDNECDNLYKCSMCGFECGCEEYDKPNFCPNCGTDMRIEDRVTMTKEEAINHLSEWMDEKMWRCFGTIDREAIGMAIKALSVDVVSRENCDQCKIDQVGVLEQQLAELLGDYETLKKAYEEALSTDVEWIPITTSEPTTSDHVFVTYNWGDDDYDDYEVSELDYWVTKCEAEEGNKQCQMFIDHVIAWSFMPQPYKEREKERNV